MRRTRRDGQRDKIFFVTFGGPTSSYEWQIATAAPPRSPRVTAMTKEETPGDTRFDEAWRRTAPT